MIKKLISMFTMKKTERVGFVDKVTNRDVCYYVDKYGDEWMANIPYYPFNFRVKIEKDEVQN
jgi:hypothetical protein